MCCMQHLAALAHSRVGGSESPSMCQPHSLLAATEVSACHCRETLPPQNHLSWVLLSRLFFVAWLHFLPTGGNDSVYKLCVSVR